MSLTISQVTTTLTLPRTFLEELLFLLLWVPPLSVSHLKATWLFPQTAFPKVTQDLIVKLIDFFSIIFLSNHFVAFAITDHLYQYDSDPEKQKTREYLKQTLECKEVFPWVTEEMRRQGGQGGPPRWAVSETTTAPGWRTKGRGRVPKAQEMRLPG